MFSFNYISCVLIRSKCKFVSVSLYTFNNCVFVLTGFGKCMKKNKLQNYVFHQNIDKST